MKQRYTKRIVAFALALAMVLTGGAFSTVFNNWFLPETLPDLARAQLLRKQP